MAEPIRILVVDDHFVVREGLRTYLNLEEDMEVVGEAADGQTALTEAARLRPDVILMDLAMPVMDGVSAMRELRQRMPDVHVIVLTSYQDDQRLLPAIQAGAAGYLLKDGQPRELARAIRAARDGKALLDPAVAARLVAAIAQHPGKPPEDALTPRELEVLSHIGRGMSNKRIARVLEISESTVKAHVGHLLAKLGAEDRTQAALHAQRMGLLEPGSQRPSS